MGHAAHNVSCAEIGHVACNVEGARVTWTSRRAYESRRTLDFLLGTGARCGINGSALCQKTSVTTQNSLR